MDLENSWGWTRRGVSRGRGVNVVGRIVGEGGGAW